MQRDLPGELPLVSEQPESQQLEPVLVALVLLLAWPEQSAVPPLAVVQSAVPLRGLRHWVALPKPVQQVDQELPGSAAEPVKLPLSEPQEPVLSTRQRPPVEQSEEA